MLGIVGAGAMGAAMAVHLSDAGRDITMFATEHDGRFVEAHLKGKPHPALGMDLPSNLLIVDPSSWEDELPKIDILILAVATPGLVSTVRRAAPFASPSCLWAIATKGLDEATLRPATAVAADEVGDPDRVVAVVGPSLASEIAAGVPTAVVCASTGARAARAVAEALGSERFRTYTSDDVIGVEVGAVMKNVVAIGVGLCDGLAQEYGVATMTNAKAFVFSRGLVEMARLTRALGGRAETILGLAGAGDLFVTVLGGRNMRYGVLVGSGMSPEQALAEMNTTVEGYFNVRAAAGLAERFGLDLPVVDVVARVLYEGLSPRAAVERLVSASVEEEL
ncbi:MAG: NAD(P)H-dependent glycerol-3-phosphate dehydrogenase [Actinomycetota bacterium]